MFLLQDPSLAVISYRSVPLASGGQVVIALGSALLGYIVHRLRTQHPQLLTTHVPGFVDLSTDDLHLADSSIALWTRTGGRRPHTSLQLAPVADMAATSFLS